jgi:hypothetical protein
MRAPHLILASAVLVGATSGYAGAASKPADPDQRSTPAKSDAKECPQIKGRFDNAGVAGRDNPSGSTGTMYLSDALGQMRDRIPAEVELHLDGTVLSGTLRFAGNDGPEEGFTIDVRCIEGAALLEFNQVASRAYPTAVKKKRTQVRLTMGADESLQLHQVESERQYTGSIADLFNRSDAVSRYRFAALSLPPGGVGGDWLAVPSGYTPVIDGRITDSSWDFARDMPLATGASVRLVHDGRYLFVAFDERAAGGWGFGTLYIGRENEVRVLHASAQVGSAVYRPNDNGTWSPEATTYSWKPVHQLVREEGWYANVATEGGAAAREFAVRLDLLKDARIALVYVREEGEDGRVIRTWPANLTGGASDMRLVEGRNPDGLTFQIEQWIALTFDK